MGLLIMVCEYPCNSSLVIARYFDAEWAKNVEDRKNTFGTCFFIGDCLMA